MTDRNGRTDFNDSGIVALFRDVAGYIETHWPELDRPAVLFGWRERQKQINEGVGGANRIVMVPGELEGADGTPEGIDGPGDNEGGTFPGATVLDGVPLPQAITQSTITPHPRGLFSQVKLVTFSLWCGAGDTPDAVVDELAAQDAIETMQEWLYRAVQSSSVGKANGTWRKHTYNRKPNEMRFGTEYLMALEVLTPYFDRDNVVIYPSAATVTRSPTQ
jgi:hypothetical protein